MSIEMLPVSQFALQNTVAELQKNVSMYENAFRLGATPRPLTPDPLSDSYSELMGIKRNSDRKSAKVRAGDYVVQVVVVVV